MKFSFQKQVSLQRKGIFTGLSGTLLTAIFFTVASGMELISNNHFKSYVYFSSFGLIETVLSIVAFALLVYSIFLSKRHKDYSFFFGWLLGMIMFFPICVYLFGVLVEGLGKYMGLWDKYEAFFLILPSILFFMFFIYSLREMNEHNKTFRL